MSKAIEAVYEDGVFKPLEEVKLREKEKVKIEIKREKKNALKSYRGIFGKAKSEELKKLEEEVVL